MPWYPNISPLPYPYFMKVRTNAPDVWNTDARSNGLLTSSDSNLMEVFFFFNILTVRRLSGMQQRVVWQVTVHRLR